MMALVSMIDDGSRARWGKQASSAAVLALLLSIGPMPAAPAIGEDAARTLPAPPANGVMGFVIDRFVPPVVQGADACPQGTALKLKDIYLAGLPEAERARLQLKENEPEFLRLWRATAFGPDNTNICTQPDMFTRPEMRTVQSKHSWGLDLDGGKVGGDTCQHENFTSPTGEQGIDNQEYRALGCALEWRGVDGIKSDQQVGLQQFMTSGEWTQVLLLRGVDSLQGDDDVEVIYGNTPDRPMTDSKGHFLPGASFSVSIRPPRHRNVLHGRILNGVLTTDPQDIQLTQTWGQGGARDIRGNRSKYDLRHARLRLVFQNDGSITGMLGGYKPVFDTIQSPAIGGAGSALVAGIDCAAELAALRKFADGIRDPRTGQCTGVSSAMQLSAVPAFVNDVPPVQRTAAR